MGSEREMENPRRYSMASFPLDAALPPQSVRAYDDVPQRDESVQTRAAKTLVSWFGNSAVPWILDIDLDFFVDDPSMPKSYGEPHANFTDVSTSGFSESKVDEVKKYIFDQTQSDDASRGVLYFETHTIEHPPRIDRRTLDAPLERLEAVLTSLLPSRPCIVTVARSNVGGYTPVADTLMIESAVLQLVRRVYGEPQTAVRYLGDNEIYPEGVTLSAADFSVVAQMLESAKTPQYKIAGQ